MSKTKASRRNDANLLKEKELIELFINMGHTTLNCGRHISDLKLNELQELLKTGIKK